VAYAAAVTNAHMSVTAHYDRRSAVPYMALNKKCERFVAVGFVGAVAAWFACRCRPLPSLDSSPARARPALIGAWA
jgi:hypothetical protein